MPRRGWNGLLAVSLAAVIAWASASPVAAAPGDLDRTFGRGGTVITNLTPWNENGADVAIQADGKIVVVGRASSRRGYGRFAVLRYRGGGRLDRGFGRDGVVITDVARREDRASAVAIQPNGKIVVVGTATVDGREAITIVRYRRAGALDRTFGEHGIATVDVGRPRDNETGEDVAIQADGKILVVGTVSGSSSFALARLDRRGALDDSFGGDGVATAEFTPGTDGGGDRAGGVAIQPNGRIVVAGDAGGPAEYTSSFGVARFLADGSLDPSFRGDGTARTNFTRWDDSPSDVAIQANGKIVVVGVAGYMWGSVPTFAIARYRSGGTLDPSFGDGGKVRTRVGGFQPGQQIDIVGSWASAVALQADGRIVVAGDADRANADRIDGRIALARYRAG